MTAIITFALFFVVSFCLGWVTACCVAASKSPPPPPRKCDDGAFEPVRQETFFIKIPNAEGTCIDEVVAIRVPVRWDEDFANWVLTNEAHQMIAKTKRDRMAARRTTFPPAKS